MIRFLIYVLVRIAKSDINQPRVLFLSFIRLLEESFVTKDPFSPDKEKFLVLGSTCSLCSMCVCVGSVRCMNIRVCRNVNI